MGSVIRALISRAATNSAQGGSFNLARGLMEVFIAAGGTFQPQVNIHRIVIENGKAAGIELSDGRTVRARQFVASTLDVHQTFESGGERTVALAFLEKLDSFQYTTWSSSAGHLARGPRFAAEKFDPNINRTLKWSIGAETMEDLFSAHQDVQAGRVPKIVHRLRTVKSARSDPGARRRTRLLLARDAAEPRARRQKLRTFRRKARDHRMLRHTARRRARTSLGDTSIQAASTFRN